MSAPRRISAKDARANFGDLLGQVYYTKEPVIVERKGRPFAVVISPEQYEILQRYCNQAWAVVDRVRGRNADKAEEEVLQDVTEAVEEVRQEVDDQAKHARPRRR
jgi:prevent-host-death family protein